MHRIRNVARTSHLPWETRHDITGKKHLHVDGEESDKQEAAYRHQGADHGPPVANSLGHNTVDHETDDLGASCSVANCRLPFGADLVGLHAIHDTGRLAVFLGKSCHTEEISQKPGVVAFHDDSERQREGEDDCLGVKLEALAEAHFAFHLGSHSGVRGELSQVGNGHGHLAKRVIFLVEDKLSLRARGGRGKAASWGDGGATTSIGVVASGIQGVRFIVRDAHMALAESSFVGHCQGRGRRQSTGVRVIEISTARQIEQWVAELEEVQMRVPALLSMSTCPMGVCYVGPNIGPSWTHP
jgi:hypothetical protein